MLFPFAQVLGLATTLSFAPHTIGLSDGKTVSAELGYLTVPERRRAPGSRPIQVAVIRLKASGPSAGAPIVFLPGSPDGASGSETIGVASLYPFFEGLRTRGDVIIVDYRGSGLSRPAIACPREPYRSGTFANKDSALSSIVGSAKQCAAS